MQSFKVLFINFKELTLEIGYFPQFKDIVLSLYWEKLFRIYIWSFIFWEEMGTLEKRASIGGTLVCVKILKQL